MRHDASRLKESAVAKSWSYRDGAAQAWLGPGSVDVEFVESYDLQRFWQTHGKYNDSNGLHLSDLS